MNKAGVVVSVDVELGCDPNLPYEHKNAARPSEEWLEEHRTLFEIFDKSEVPVTWAIVGAGNNSGENWTL